MFRKAAPLLLVVLVSTPARGAEPRALEISPTIDLAVTGAAGVGWIVSEVLKGSLAPVKCRICGDPNGFDASARSALKWQDVRPANTASNAFAFGVVPVGMLGGLYAAGPRDRRFLEDALLVVESTALAGALNQTVKFLAGRERPFVHALPEAEKAHTDQPADNNLSFYSGHTSFTTALGTSAAMVATLRGYSFAPALWVAGVGGGLLTGYFRVAGDRHYATDVLTGAVLGAAFGVAVPWLHRPREGGGGSSPSFFAEPNGLGASWTW